MTTLAWIIGARGLLGRSIGARLRSDRRWHVIDDAPLPWHDLDALAEAAADRAQRMIQQATSTGTRWAVFWTAGTVVTSSAPEAVAREFRQFEIVLGAIAEALGTGPATGSGAVFFSSSAGGVYAGASDPPFDESTPPAPLSPYGRMKLDAETELASFTERAAVSTVVGRISNLYGPGQQLAKMQGLISHLARSQYSATPTSLYVPLDTLRDYLYVDDAASLIADLVHRALDEADQRGPIHVVKNVIRGQAVSISALLGYVRTVTKGTPRVVSAASPSAGFQAVDLRLASVTWPELDRREFTTLPAGLQATMADVLARIQAGSAA